MTELEINKTITEAMELCWHELLYSFVGSSLKVCRKCNKKYVDNPSYIRLWSDYGQALEWAMEKEKIKKDILRNPFVYLNPLTGATRIVLLLGAKND